MRKSASFKRGQKISLLTLKKREKWKRDGERVSERHN